MIVYLEMLITKLLYSTKISIFLNQSYYFNRERFKNRLRNFQPEYGPKIKNKPG